MVSGIRFMAASGAFGNTIANLYTLAGQATTRAEIFNFTTGDTDSPNRLGFFGANGAPSSPVIVGQYQDRTHITNHIGADLGQIINCKFTGASLAEISGVAYSATFADIPSESGTLLCRFTEPNATAVQTQNAVFRAINLLATSGAPDLTDLATGITVRAVQLPDTQGFTGGTSWSEISSGGSSLSLNAQTSEQVVHDYHLMVSATPAAAGRKINFAYFMQLEFL